MTEPITFGSTFSGIGAFEEAVRRVGGVTLFQSEKNRHSCAVLRRHFPTAIQLGEIQGVTAKNAPAVNVVVGGSPCQNFSIGGDQKGLAGKESSLFREYIRVISQLRPSLAVWENVVGAFSTNSGRDFVAVIAAFRDIGTMDVAWRTFDAAYAGVPQRRRRVFLVADFTDRCCAGEILFERRSDYRDAPPQYVTGQDVAYCLTTKDRYDSNANETFIGVPDHDLPADHPSLFNGMRVRGLTCLERERLQGFEDEWTRWDADGNEIADTNRKWMLGNSIAVPVAEWILGRLVNVMQGVSYL